MRVKLLVFAAIIAGCCALHLGPTTTKCGVPFYASSAALRLVNRFAVGGEMSGITPGHITLYDPRARGLSDPDRLDPKFVRHELEHAYQAQKRGRLFVPEYLLQSATDVLRGGNGYDGNPFEVAAELAEGRPMSSEKCGCLMFGN